MVSLSNNPWACSWMKTAAVANVASRHRRRTEQAACLDFVSFVFSFLISSFVLLSLCRRPFALSSGRAVGAARFPPWRDGESAHPRQHDPPRGYFSVDYR